MREKKKTVNSVFYANKMYTKKLKISNHRIKQNSTIDCYRTKLLKSKKSMEALIFLEPRYN